MIGILLLFLSGCQSAQLSDVQEMKPTEIPTATPRPAPTVDPELSWEDKLAFYKKAEEREGLSVVFSAESGFYSKDISLELTAEGAAEIFYTDDGSEPWPSSTRYTQPIVLTATDAELPRCAVIRAAAYYSDGTKSPVFTRTFFLNNKIGKRFSLPVFSIVAPPEELTSGPLALLVGKRAQDTSEKAKRDVLLQVFLKNGDLVMDQAATLRVYGDSSRDMPVKSLRLIAGTDAQAEPQSFAYSFFGTSNAQGEALDHYTQLVLSSSEADFQYAFIRDELAQSLAKLARFQDYEDVQPVVVYINGEYYGLEWLHEVYSNEFFQAIYGASEGRYAVIDWNAGKAEPLDQADQDAAAAFQETYEQFLKEDLYEKETLARLQRFMDVENYLDYCALNIIIDNPEWPSHMLAYAYIPADGDAQSAQWRFLPHDMDHAFGLKGGKEAAEQDTLEEALHPDSARYAPLFAALMEREEYRTYFAEKVWALLEDKLSKDSMLAALKELHDARNGEMQHYFSRIDALKKVRNSGIWMKKKDFSTAYSALTDYIKARPAAVQKMMDEHLPLDTP